MDDIILNFVENDRRKPKPKKPTILTSCLNVQESPEVKSVPTANNKRKLSQSLSSADTNVSKKLKVGTVVRPAANRNLQFSSVTREKETSQKARRNPAIRSKSDASSNKNEVKINYKPRNSTPSSLIQKAEETDIASIMSGSVGARTEAVFSNKSFSEMDIFHPHLVACLADRMGLTTMTEIQRISIAAILDGQDTLIKAQTGSGKTLAYALPIVQELQAREPPINRKAGTFALIITPTRELATQTLDTLTSVTNPFVRIVSTALIGGTRKKAQKNSIRKGVNILVATPKRLLDHLNSTSSLDLSQLAWLVIDEADRLLEMGFERDIAELRDKIMQRMSFSGHRLQTILLSATLTPGVEKLAGISMIEPAICSVRNQSSASTEEDKTSAQFAMPAGLKNYLLLVPAKLRIVALASFLLLKCRYNKKGGKVIVFFSSQFAVDFHYKLFKGVLCSSEDDLVYPEAVTDMELYQLHGSMEHAKRQSVFRDYSICKSGVLLTTDVASRGLDISEVAWVIQYHAPPQPVDYVHRVGRTARAGGKGKALLFLQPDTTELGFLTVLGEMGITLDKMDLGDLLKTTLVHVKNTKMKTTTKMFRTMTTDESVSHFQRSMEDFVAEEPGLKELAERAYVSYVRSYVTFSREMRRHFDFKQLHLGHLARSFCLRETPREIADTVFKKRKEEAESGEGKVLQKKKAKPSDMARKNMMAEFGL